MYCPGLASHPQHALARRQQTTGGGIVGFEVKGGREEVWDDTAHSPDKLYMEVLNGV